MLNQRSHRLYINFIYNTLFWMTTVVNVNEGKWIDLFYRNNLQVVLIIHTQELAQDLAQDQSTVKARNVNLKTFLHILRSQNVMLISHVIMTRMDMKKRSADQDLKCDPIPKKPPEICKSNFTLTKYIVCFDLFNSFSSQTCRNAWSIYFLAESDTERLTIDTLAILNGRQSKQLIFYVLSVYKIQF